MKLDLGYNVFEAPLPERSFTLLPPDWYLFKIEKADDMTSKSNSDNKYLKLQLSVAGADYTGRKVFKNINYKNSNAEAEKIAASELRELMEAIGVREADPDLFIGRAVYGRVKIRKGGNGFEDQNDIAAFKAVDSAAPVSAPKTSSPPF